MLALQAAALDQKSARPGRLGCQLASSVRPAVLRLAIAGSMQDGPVGSRIDRRVALAGGMLELPRGLDDTRLWSFQRDRPLG